MKIECTPNELKELIGREKRYIDKLIEEASEKKSDTSDEIKQELLGDKTFLNELFKYMQEERRKQFVEKIKKERI